jgi:hypothetical protein
MNIDHFMTLADNTTSPGQNSISGGPRGSSPFVSVPPLGKGSGASVPSTFSCGLGFVETSAAVSARFDIPQAFGLPHSVTY